MTNSVTAPKPTDHRVPHGELADTVLAALTTAGLPTATVDQAREMLIRGLVCGIWGETVHKLGNGHLIPVADAIEDLVDRVYQHQSLKPLIDAARTPETSPAAEPGHWPWCKPGACVTHNYDDGETYIEHYGREATAVIVDTDGTDGTDTVRLKAHLGFDESTTKEHPDVSLEDPDGDCVFLDAPTLDSAITQLQKFVNDLRLMHTQLTDETGNMTDRAKRDGQRIMAAIPESKPEAAA